MAYCTVGRKINRIQKLYTSYLILIDQIRFNDGTRTRIFLAVEKLFFDYIKTEYKLQGLIYLQSTILRVIFAELTRILNHLLALKHMQWMWSDNSFFVGVRRREKLMEFYERVSGAECMQLIFVLVVQTRRTKRPIRRYIVFVESLINELMIFIICSENRIWKDRLLAQEYYIRGCFKILIYWCLLRGSGGMWDLRKRFHMMLIINRV